MSFAEPDRPRISPRGGAPPCASVGGYTRGREKREKKGARPGKGEKKEDRGCELQRGARRRLRFGLGRFFPVSSVRLTAGQSGRVLYVRESIFSETHTKWVLRNPAARASARRGVPRPARRSVGI